MLQIFTKHSIQPNTMGTELTDYAMKIATDFAKGSKNDREELFVADCDGV